MAKGTQLMPLMGNAYALGGSCTVFSLVTLTLIVHMTFCKINFCSCHIDYENIFTPDLRYVHV